MNKFTQTFTVLILAFFVMSAPSFAQDAAPAQDGAPAADAAPTPNPHPLYVGIMAGANFFSTDRISKNTTSFTYGGHAGIDTFSVGGFSKMAFGFEFDNTNLGNKGDSNADLISYGTVVAQAIFHNVMGSGLYFGPEGGFTIVSLDNVSTDAYVFGGVIGYEWKFCSHLSLAPEVHYDRIGTANLTIFQVPKANMFKAFLALNYHLN